MYKYPVEAQRERKGNIPEARIIALCENQETAEKIAQKAFENLSDEERKTEYIIVGEINEDDLTDRNDWDSYNRIQVISEYVDEENV